MSIIQAWSLPLLYFSSIKQQICDGWEVVVLCKIAETVVVNGNESV